MMIYKVELFKSSKNEQDKTYIFPWMCPYNRSYQ